MATQTIKAADLFCGAGGTSTGLSRACQKRNLKLDLTAINHWPTAIATHTRNHPEARHLCESLDSVDPRQVVTGELDLLMASPECTHHSVARGGKPINDQSRTTAWHVVRWAEALRPRSILVENVREFQTWGPIGVNGRPLKSKKGETFQAWLNALRSLGYSVEHRILCAADYGDPTTRRRLFVIARRGRRAIRWPEPTHSAQEEKGLFEQKRRWRAAREIIDWKITGESIFGRKRPLSENTMKRIAAGLQKYGGQSFLLPHRQFDGMQVDSVDTPIRTITAHNGSDNALVQPFLVSAHEGINRRVHSLENPLPTQECSNRFGLVEPFLVSAGGPKVDARPVSEPMNTVLCRDHMALVEPFLTKYYGTGVCQSVEEPIDTVTARDRFGLVETQMDGIRLDIRFRMLQPHELAAAMGFPQDYQFEGTRSDKVRQVGNAVPVGLAEALCDVVLP